MGVPHDCWLTAAHGLGHMLTASCSHTGRPKPFEIVSLGLSHQVIVLEASSHEGIHIPEALASHPNAQP